MTALLTQDQIYGPEYYASHCGTVPYERNAHWVAFFGGIADRIIASFGPARVYDAGCAWGFLVEALWDRGVEAIGRDISSFAISRVRPDVRGFCEVGDVAGPAPPPGRFDLVTCIEVLEHMPEQGALAALDVFVAAAPRILFSSSPSDFAEPTHINVRPVLYWLRELVTRGFCPDWTHDATYLAPHAFVAVRCERPPGDGELRLFAEWIRVRSALIEREQRIGRMSGELASAKTREAAALSRVALMQQVETLSPSARDSLAIRELLEARDELAALQAELQGAQARFGVAHADLQARLEAAERRAQAIETSRTWRATVLARNVVSRVPGARSALSGVARHGRVLLPQQIARRLARSRDGAAPVDPPAASPPPGFEPASYLAANPDVLASGADPLDHWLNHGEREGRPLVALPPEPPPVPIPEAVSYQAWLEHVAQQGFGAGLQRQLALQLDLQPLVSVITPVYRIAAEILADTITSVAAQTYSNWELCLAVADNADAARTRLLQDWARRDPRVRVEILAENGGISRNSDAALAMARGEWAVLLDHDDMLTEDALFELVRAVNDDPAVDFIYSDKDQVAADGTTRQHPLFKQSWSPDIMLSANYLTHANMMRVDRLREIGGWDPKTDGAQDWDLFLRVIGPSGRVRHVPKVLYHWRQVPTSVAGGGAAAKPYAAEAQLRVIGHHLRETGWPGAQPRFEGPFIRVQWAADWRPRVSLVILGNGEAVDVPAFEWPDPIEILAAPGAVTAGAQVVPSAPAASPALRLDALVAAASGEVVVVWDGGLQATSPDWLAELVGPLANPDIAAVAGTVLGPDGRIVAFGAFYADGEVRPGFQGLPQFCSGPYGSPSWYSNASIMPLRLAALRRADWQALGGCAADADTSRPDLALTLRLSQSVGRILLNPFATAAALQPDPFAQGAAAVPIADLLAAALPNGDPYVSPHLTFSDTGWMTFRLPQVRPATDHNFAAEARYAATAYDATVADVDRSRSRCAAAAAAPLASACWVVPEIDVPFYGGIHTILRAADHMLARHQVRPVLAVVGARNEAIVRSRIGLAFPRLAAEATIHLLRDASDPVPCGPVDALLSTLWVTAFPALRETEARRKFTFVQDWEPLFYPAGTISGLVEATYRFGFHAVCNTASLADSYRALGGTADHFQPAIDPTVFRPRRLERTGSAIVRLFCYMRPAAPRNCFEMLAAALRRLKERHGAGLEILTAGAWWDPAAHGLDRVVRHLGLLPYAETGALYRACDIGLVAMATRHPSYLPLELMACGAAVVSNRNPHTGWLLRDGENAVLCDLTRGDIACAVNRLIDEPKLREAVVHGGYETIRQDHSDWDVTGARIHSIVDTRCRTP